MLLFQLSILALGLFSANALPGPAGHTAKPVDVARATVDAPFPFLPNFGPTTAPSSLQNDSTIPVYNGTTHITLEMIWALIRIPMDQRRMWGPWLGPTLGTVPRNSDQYCWYPHNPDIAGIGVRTTLYIQSLVVVVLSLVSRFRQKSPSESLSGIQRTQVYTVFAFVIAGLEQRGTGQLSIFHETIAVHLAFLSISSAWIGMPASVEEPAEQWLVPGLSEHPRLAYLFRSANWHNASGGFRLVIQSVVRSMAELGADWYSMLLMLPVVYGIGYDFHQNVETCFPDVGEAWASRGDLKWLAYRLLIMKWFIPIAIGALIGIIGYRASNLGVPKVVKAWKLQQRAIQLGVVLFLVVWVLEVIAIEGSLKNLPYFHTAEEDQWGFGQIFPLVLLLPLWEAISDVLFARREEMSLAATINRQHREACIQSQCDVQLVYDRENIRCGFHLTPYISHLVLETLPASAYVIVTDSNVAPLHLATLEQQLRIGSSSARIILYVAPTGTTFKSRELAGQLEDYLVENHCEADTVLIALGGGTVADLGGFVAATFMKGIPFVQIPTSLAEMVHSGLATHATVNLAALRNGSGVPSEPRYVFVDFVYLETLPSQEIYNGMAEIIQTRCIFWKHDDRTSLMRFDEQIAKSVGDQGRKVDTRSDEQQFFYSIVFEAISDRAALMKRARKDRAVARLFDVGHTVAEALQEILGPGSYGEFLAIGLVFEHQLLLLHNQISSNHLLWLKACLQKWCLPVSLRDPRITSLITSKLLNADELLQAISKNLRTRGLNDFEIVFLTDGDRAFVSSISPDDRTIKNLCLERLQLAPPSVPHQKVSVTVPASRSELHYALAFATLQRYMPAKVTRLQAAGRIPEETHDFIRSLSVLTRATIAGPHYFANAHTIVVTTVWKESSKSSYLAPTWTQKIQVRSTSSSLCYLLAFCVLARPPKPRKRYIFISRDHPMKKTHVFPLIDALRANGSVIAYSETPAGGYTLDVTPAPQRGGHFQLAASAPGTPVAALLMCAARALAEVKLEFIGSGPVVSQRWIDFAIKQMKATGVEVTRHSNHTTGEPLNIYTVPTRLYLYSGDSVSDDASLANCYLALGAIGGTTVELKRKVNHQPDEAFIFDVLQRMGCQVVQNKVLRKRTTVTGPAVGTLKPLGDLNMSHMPKSFLLAVVLSAVAWDPQRPHSSTRITGIKKQKGLHRIQIAARELAKFGVQCTVLADGIEVFGTPIARLKRNLVVDCSGDHRLALAFSILGAVVGPIILDDKHCTDRLFPTWWIILEEKFGLTVDGAAVPPSALNGNTPDPSLSIIVTGKPSVCRIAAMGAAAVQWGFVDATEGLENPLGTAVFEDFLRTDPRRQIIYVGDNAAQAGSSAAETLCAYTSGHAHLVHVSERYSPQQTNISSWLSDCTPTFELILSATDLSQSRVTGNGGLLAVAQEIRRFFKHVVNQREPIDLSPARPTYVLDLALPDITPALPSLNSVAADALELRVDLLEETPVSGTTPALPYVAEQLSALRRHSPLPVIFSLRSTSHGGRHPDADADAAFALFEFAIRAGCEYIAVDPIWPRDRLERLVRDAHASHTLVIASAHDPLGTLDWSGSGVRDQYATCAAFGDVVRISSEARTAESNFALRGFLSAVPTHRKRLPSAAVTTGPYGQLSRVFNSVLTPVGMPGSEDLNVAEINGMRDFHDPPLVRPVLVFYLLQDGDASIQRTCLEAAFSLWGLPQTCSVLRDAAELPGVVQRPDFAGFCVDVPHKAALLTLLKKQAPNVSQTQHADIVVPLSGSPLYGVNAMCLGLQAALLRGTVISTETRALVLGADASVICALCELGVGRVYVFDGESPGHAAAARVLAHFPVEWQGRVTVLDELRQLPASVSLVIAAVRANVGQASVASGGISVPAGLLSGQGGCIVDLDVDAWFIRSAEAAGCSWATISAVEVLVERGIQLAQLATGRSIARDQVLERAKLASDSADLIN